MGISLSILLWLFPLYFCDLHGFKSFPLRFPHACGFGADLIVDEARMREPPAWKGFFVQRCELTLSRGPEKEESPVPQSSKASMVSTISI